MSARIWWCGVMSSVDGLGLPVMEVEQKEDESENEDDADYLERYGEGTLWGLQEGSFSSSEFPMGYDPLLAQLVELFDLVSG